MLVTSHHCWMHEACHAVLDVDMTISLYIDYVYPYLPNREVLLNNPSHLAIAIESFCLVDRLCILQLASI